MEFNIAAILVLLVIGAVIYVISKKILNKAYSWLKERAPLLKRYWRFVIPLLIITMVSYIIVYVYYPSEINVALIGQISGLVLAVFAGYIAFSELGESRFDKLEESGMETFRIGEFKLAQTRLEEAHAIKPKEISLLANLMELYLILGLYEKFEAKISHYRRYILEEKEELILRYLICLKELVQDRQKDAKLKIKEEVIKYVSDHPRSRDTLGWNTKELQGTEAYKLLGSETKAIIQNLVLYITDSLSAEDEKKFIDGDYVLKSK